MSQEIQTVSKFAKFADSVGNIPTKHPKLFGVMACVPYMALALHGGAMADYKDSVQKVINELVSIASVVCSGAGVIVTIMAVYNWLSALKQQDSERAASNVTNILIGVVLIFIGPIIQAILKLAGINYVDGTTSAANNSSI
jgi:hypothetical protein